MEASFNFSASFTLDSDEDGWTDYMEQTYYYTDPQQADGDGDGVSDKDDIDPLTDLKVTFTSKRVYASEYTYTWREGEDWDRSVTKWSGADKDWSIETNESASNGYFTRQDEVKDNWEVLGDYAEWDFTVKKAGVYYFFMRSHRYNNSTSNICLSWENNTGSYEIYDRKWDDGGPGYEICWYQNTTDEWKWSWYGLLELQANDEGAVKIENIVEDFGEGITRPGDPEWWIEVDNILITDDPHCYPSGKGIEGSEDNTIGYNTYIPWDNGEGQGGSGPDFYLKTTIDSTINTSDVFKVDDFNVLTDWKAIVDVSDEKGNEDVSISIELWDKDTTNNDDQCDISSSGKTCEIYYNLENATWWGEDGVLDTDYIGRTCGEVDGTWSSASDANVIFEINQNDNDNDGISYWQEINVYDNKRPINPAVKNDRNGIIIGGGASCKVRQKSNIGSFNSPYMGTYLLYEKGSSWENYTVEVDLMTDKPDEKNKVREDIGVIFRYQNDNNFYILRWEQNGIFSRMLLDKIVEGNRINLDKKYTYLKRGDWYTIGIVCNGSNIEVWKNNNKNNRWKKIFDLNDNQFDSGSIALFCWKNNESWFDDVLVFNEYGDILLEEGFDHGMFFYWKAYDHVSGQSNWSITKRRADMEDFYITPDFVYRELLIIGHYEKDRIYYENVDKWRDADGDGENDVNCLSTKGNVRYSMANWLRWKSNRKDMNLIYIFDHGYYANGVSMFGVDNNRNGAYNDDEDQIFDVFLDLWLPRFTYDLLGHGRLIFIIEACYVGHFIDVVGGLIHAAQKRITISSSPINS